MSNTNNWYMSIGGHQVGPVSENEVIASIRSKTIDGTSLVWGPELKEWTPLAKVPRFAAEISGSKVPPPHAPSMPGRRAHDIDFIIRGDDMQFVEVELDPGECAIAEAGSMMYMTNGIAMQTVFGDGNAQSQGFLGKLVGAGKRIVTGESLFMTVYENKGQGKQRVAFAAPYPGKILPMDLAQLGGELICQKDSFLCAARGVEMSIAFQKRIGVGLFGGEGFIMQRLTGDGLTFVHAGGCVHSMDLAGGETLRIDTGCVVAYQPTIDFDIQFVGGIKTALFGGEGLFFATLRGPGRVWLQSLPLSRLADRITSASRSRKEEGSVLGGLGNLLDGRE
ncbi:MAG: TIGR00266 family protein [Planctomycetota bacterium]|nr:TIGR00266 family protein [Planctomycetota bacterium]